MNKPKARLNLFEPIRDILYGYMSNLDVGWHWKSFDENCEPFSVWRA